MTPTQPTPARQKRFALSPASELVGVAARIWIAIAAIAVFIEFFRQTTVGLTDGELQPFGADFINYWSAAALAWSGRANEIYDWLAFHEFQQGVVGAKIGPFHYSYPPVLIVLTLPLAALPYVPAFALWLLASFYAFWRALRAAMPNGGALLLALAVPAGYINFVGGQNAYWTAALIGGGLVLLDRRPAIAGVLFGLMIYKPHLGLLIPVALIAGRQWLAFLTASATAVVLIGASVALFGADLWADYAASAAKLRQWILEDGADTFHRMLSVFAAARRVGFDVTASYLIQAASALCAAAVVAVAWYRDALAPVRYSLLIVGTFLATPYLQDYDLVVGAFIPAWLFASRNRFPATSAMVISALILIAPLLAASVGKMTGYVLGPLFLIPAFVLLARMSPAVAK